MRVRLATLLALVLIALPVTHVLGAVAASADTGGRMVLAQETTNQSDEGQGGETGNKEGKGQSDADAETGAGEDEDAPPAEEEEGPVWTYQMAWIVIGLLILMGIGVAAAYYKLVVQRQRAGV